VTQDTLSWAATDARMLGMPTEVQLLGPPIVTRDGVVHAAPRGRKVWGLLAYLALAEQAPTRQLLIDLLFPEAEDPANALRWNLSELRRLLGGPDTVGSGNTVELRLPAGSRIDVLVLQAGTSDAAVELPGLGRELLEAVRIEATPGFDAWLLAQRRRVASLSGSVLREGALQALAAGEPAAAIGFATRLVGADPLNADAHIVLVRSFAAAGDETAVQEQLTTSRDLFRDELGLDLASELYEAARMAPRGPARLGPAAARAMIESGEAAVGAGAIDAGVRELREAAEAAAGDPVIEALAWCALGSALVHATKGRDEEGAAALHRAIRAAQSEGDSATLAAAHRELGYVEVLRAAYARGAVQLRRAAEFAGDDDLEMSKVRSVVGVTLADQGKHEQAAVEFRAAIDLAKALEHGRQLAWSHTFMGRLRLLRGELDEAEDSLSIALEHTHAERWTAFLPYPEALLAEVWIRRGLLDQATETFEHAFALGCSVDDACWEAYSVRGLGLLLAARGDLDGALATLEDAMHRCARQRDTHRWLRGYVLDAMCAIGTVTEHPAAEAWVTDLAAFAGHAGMREFMVHAYLSRRDLGDPDALEAARTLAVEVENPSLHARLDGGGSRLGALLGAS
jgi:DNA-binding SARP family transcriptional activator